MRPAALHHRHSDSPSNSSRQLHPLHHHKPIMALLRAPLPSLLPLVHCLGFLCSIMILLWIFQFRGGLSLISDDKDLIFNVHPVLMFIGFIVLASEAILVYKTVPGTKNYKKSIHLTLHAMALLLATIGVWAAFKYHSEKGIDNLYSLHSWLGLGTVIMFGLQWVVGYVIYWYPGGVGKSRTALLPWHVFMGLLIHCLALATAETGLLEKLSFLILQKKIGKFSTEAILVNSTGVCIVLYGALVVLAAIVPNARKEVSSRSAD